MRKMVVLHLLCALMVALCTFPPKESDVEVFYKKLEDLLCVWREQQDAPADDAVELRTSSRQARSN
jgi:hypothetical protein